MYYWPDLLVGVQMISWSCMHVCVCVCVCACSEPGMDGLLQLLIWPGMQSVCVWILEIKCSVTTKTKTQVIKLRKEAEHNHNPRLYISACRLRKSCDRVMIQRWVHTPDKNTLPTELSRPAHPPDPDTNSKVGRKKKNRKNEGKKLAAYWCVVAFTGMVGCKINDAR